MKIKKYARLWWILCLNSFRTQMSTSLASSGYLIGKLVRFGFFLAYLLAIFRNLPGLKGYDMPSVVLFFMTFNVIDVGAQFLFRGLYGVKTLIDEGLAKTLYVAPNGKHYAVLKAAERAAKDGRRGMWARR
jgi:ABC-type uncharacterized transport system permease subunit